MVVARWGGEGRRGGRGKLGDSAQNLDLPTSASRHASVKFLEANQGEKVEAFEESLSRNRKLPTYYGSNGVYGVAKEQVVEEEEGIDDEEE